MKAGVAAAAEHLGFNRHLLPGPKILYVLSGLYDLTGYLMPLGNGIRGVRMGAVVDMDVAAADADLFDLYQDLIRARFRNGNFPEMRFSRALS